MLVRYTFCNSAQASLREGDSLMIRDLGLGSTITTKTGIHLVVGFSSVKHKTVLAFASDLNSLFSTVSE